MIERKYQFWFIALSTALISFSVISFEVILTRIFSVMLSYHFVFAILSFALLGLGFGGMTLKLWQRIFHKATTQTNVALFALFITLSTILIVKLPIFASGAFVDFRTWIYIFLATIPFFFAGLTLADIFEQYAGRISLIYGFDLLGATGGALTVVLLLNTVGGTEAALFTSMIAATVVLFLGIAEKKHTFTGVISVFFVIIIFSVIRFGNLSLEVPIAEDVNKDMYRALANPADNAEIVESRWSAFGRTDLVRIEQSPEEMLIFIDGAAGSPMYNLETLMSDTMLTAHHIYHSGEFFPFFFLEENEKDNALIIGPGGGRDVVVALLGKVNSITAVEVNPDMVQIVKDYEEFNGGIYSDYPNVDVVVGEGRNFIRNSDSQYDLIMLALPITKSYRSLEGYILTENFLFTVEAFEDYLDHLTPEGRIIIVAHNKVEIYRTIVQALAAFRKKGLSEQEAMNHIYSYSSGMMPAVVIKNQPFDSLETDLRHTMMHLLGYDKDNLFVPLIQQQVVRPLSMYDINDEWRMFDQFLMDVSTGKYSIEQLAKTAPVEIGPVYDDSPFFYKFNPGLPDPLSSFAILIFFSIIMLCILILLKYDSIIVQSTFLKNIIATPQQKLFLLIFFLLGSGFMIIEIALFQRLILFIGQPIMALTVLLFSLLLGTGLGSISSSLIPDKSLNRMLTTVLMIITILILFYTLLFMDIFRLGFNPKITAAILLLSLGFVMGFPFPISIRLMKKHDFGDTVHFMWGINGIASVLGSALAMIMGVSYGFTYALFLGAIIYGCVALLSVSFRRIKLSNFQMPLSVQEFKEQ